MAAVPTPAAAVLSAPTASTDRTLEAASGARSDRKDMSFTPCEAKLAIACVGNDARHGPPRKNEFSLSGCYASSVYDAGGGRFRGRGRPEAAGGAGRSRRTPARVCLRAARIALASGVRAHAAAGRRGRRGDHARGARHRRDAKPRSCALDSAQRLGARLRRRTGFAYTGELADRRGRARAVPCGTADSRAYGS